MRFFRGAVHFTLPCSKMLLHRCPIRRNGSFIWNDSVFWGNSPFNNFWTLIGYIKHLLWIASVWVCVSTATPVIAQDVIVWIIHYLLLFLPHEHFLASLGEYLPTPAARNGHSITLLRGFAVHVSIFHSTLLLISLIDHHWVEFCRVVHLRWLLLRRASVGRERLCRCPLSWHLRAWGLVTLIVNLGFLQFYLRLEVLLLLGILINLISGCSWSRIINDGWTRVMKYTRCHCGIRAVTRFGFWYACILGEAILHPSFDSLSYLSATVLIVVFSPGSTIALLFLIFLLVSVVLTDDIEVWILRLEGRLCHVT